MAHAITPLCSERHYMGASSRGRFATDRDVRPDYNRPPSPAARAQRLACRPAVQTRYLRGQHVVALVLDCQQAKDELAWGEAMLGRLTAEHAEAQAKGDVKRTARLERIAGKLHRRLAQTLALRKELSRELRLIGISPKEQASILREAHRRIAALQTDGPAAA